MISGTKIEPESGGNITGIKYIDERPFSSAGVVVSWF
jgi:hypothetical protein